MHPTLIKQPLTRAAIVPALAVGLLSACGGGTGNTGSSGGSAPVSAVVSASSPLSNGCGMAANGSGDTVTLGSAVQPQVAAIPGGALVGVWEQDRWSGAGARAILSARSTDNGMTWSTPQALAFSACGTASAPGAGYDRASDPWVAFGGSGVIYASALAFSAANYLSQSGLSGVLVSRSLDGGVTWSAPQVVIADTNAVAAGPFVFNDRDSIAADAAGNAYLVWDRITTDSTASGIPGYIATSADSGASWSAARVLYSPGPDSQSFNNEIAILPNGNLLDVFTLLGSLSSGTPTTSLQVLRSTDHGATWNGTPPKKIADIVSVGTTNPIPSGTAIRDGSLMAQLAVDSGTGNVAVVWQQSFGSASFDGIALSVSKDNGATWSTMAQINGVKSVAAFNPTIRYLPGGVLAVTYDDFRDFASGSSVLSTSAWLTESSDGGATWHELRLQAPFDLTKAPLANHQVGFFFLPALFLGDNQGLALAGSSALPFYAATSGTGAHVYATRAPDPLTLATAHVYQAAATNGALPAAAAARAALNTQRVLSRQRAAPAPR